MRGHALLIAAAIAPLAVLLISPARAHDWYSNALNTEGERCCGGKECGPLADGDAVEVAGGFLIRSLGITVPFSHVQPSPDGHFHACIWWTPKQEVKCFFSPMPAS